MNPGEEEMTRQARWIAALVIVAALGGTLFLIGGRQGASPDVERVRIGTFMTAIDYSPYFIAKEKGWFEEELKGTGIVVEYVPPFQTLPPVNEAIATDRVDVVMTADVPALVGRAAGVDLQVPWLSCTLHSEVAVPASSGARSLGDLKGRKVAVLYGTGPHYGLLHHFERSGIARGDVSLVNMPPPEAKAAFESGAVDAWAVFPPFIEQELVEGRARVLPGVKTPVQVVVAVRGRLSAEHPKALPAILAALERAKEWLRQNPGEAQGLLSRELGLPPEVVKLSWTKLDWGAQLDPAVIDDFQAKADFLKAEQFIKNPVDVRRDLIRVPERPPSARPAGRKAA
jgi:sulfonate transport system substrate-binding protein